MMAMMAETGSR